MSRQDLRCITLPVLSFRWDGKSVFSLGCLALHFLSMFFHSAHSSPLMHLPTHLCPVFPTAPSAPHLPYSTLLALSSSVFILPWLYHFVLVIPTALPCPQRPSHFLLLPPASLGSLAISAGGNPAEHFPTTRSSDRCPNLYVSTACHAQGTW